MNNNRNRRISAGDIFGQRFQKNVKQYFHMLSQAIVYEYEAYGYCALINRIIEKQLIIDALTYSGIRYAFDCLMDKKCDTDDYIQLGVKDHNDEIRITWDECQTIIKNDNYAMYEYERTHDLIIGIRKQGEIKHIRMLANTDFPLYIEMQYKPKTTTNDFEEIIDFSDNPEAPIGIADMVVFNNKANAEAENCELENRNVEIPQMIQDYLDKQRDEYERANQYSLEKAKTDFSRATESYEELHDKMVEQSNYVQSSWTKSLEETIQSLNAINDDFHNYIRKWQVSLYPQEIKPLASCYVRLYQIVNIDKLISEELFIETDSNGKRIDNTDSEKNNLATNNETAEDNGEKVVSSPVISELSKLNRKLTYFLRDFEQALSGFDMYVYFPKEGEKFDETEHTIENDTEFEPEKEHIITKCILPGIKKRISDSNDEVIICAEVTVREV